MIDRAWAECYALEWAANWNEGNLESLLTHYAPKVVFRSPRIPIVLGTNRSFVSGIEELRAYWSKALEPAKDIRFEVDSVGVGGDAVTIIYRTHRDDHVAETLIFGEDLKVIEGIVTYLASVKRRSGERRNG
jgi:ketosteroid isomerase-like protein